jgi:hypothetical protein
MEISTDKVIRVFPKGPKLKAGMEITGALEVGGKVLVIVKQTDANQRGVYYKFRYKEQEPQA